MSGGGVIGISRGIWTDPDFKDEPFTEREAFMWLVSEAAWKERKKRGAYGPVVLKRGELCHSVRFMGNAWGWSKSRVARFLNKLKNRDIIRDTKRDSEQIYYISNYNKFQVVGLPDQDTKQDDDRDSSGTAAGQQRDKLEERKHLNIKEKKAKATPRSELEKVLDAEHAIAVIEHRQRLRKPMTAHAAKLLAQKLAECPDANAAADTMMERGWQSIKPEWLIDNPSGKSSEDREYEIMQGL